MIKKNKKTRLIIWIFVVALFVLFPVIYSPAIETSPTKSTLSLPSRIFSTIEDIFKRAFTDTEKKAPSEEPRMPKGLGDDEMCNNNIDDDADGAIDCLDIDCSTHLVCYEDKRLLIKQTGDIGEASLWYGSDLALTAEQACQDQFQQGCGAIQFTRGDLWIDPPEGAEGFNLYTVWTDLGYYPNCRFPFVELNYQEDFPLRALCYEADCIDTHDNDADELIDCADPDCDNRDCSRDLMGNVIPDSAKCGDLVCKELYCEDREPDTGYPIDNDNDGLANCADSDCAGQRGGTISGSVVYCEETETTCNDYFDNDGDCIPVPGDLFPCGPGDQGIDCLDPDCAGRFGPRGNRCCAFDEGCEGPGAECVSYECKETNCMDTNDNDGDNKTDCDDRDCCFHPDCVSNPVCATEICDNTIDDNANGLVDCADRDCTNRPACTGVPGEEICDNNEDDDLDGYTDCEDIDCAGDLVCAAGPGAEVEICDNNIDDDGDDRIDCADHDCSFPTPLEPTFAGLDMCWEHDCENDEDDDGDGDTDCDDNNCLYPNDFGIGGDICWEQTCGDDIDNDRDCVEDTNGDEVVCGPGDFNFDCSDPNCHGNPGCD